MTILDKITATKAIQVAELKKRQSIQDLEQLTYFSRPTISLCDRLRQVDDLGIISEFKRHSPSKGDINPNVTVEQVTTSYQENGAAGLSILTDMPYFKGSIQDVITARPLNNIPILRKEFIIDEYQIVEAKAIGADVILLIAECLDKTQIYDLAQAAKQLGLEVLMELHSAEQLDKVCEHIDIVGVNNRNLKDFSVSIKTSLDLFHDIPDDFVRISESGINNPNAIVELRRMGFQGFLIGEYFMKHQHPGQALAAFAEECKHIEDLLNNAIA